MNTRQTLGMTVGLLVVIALAFGAGYGAWPLLHGTGAVSVSAAPAAAPAPSDAAAEGDLSLFWEAWQLLDGSFYGPLPSDEQRVRGAVRGMVDSFGDPYTLYVDPQPRELERDRLRGSFGGVGAAIELSGTRYLLHPLPGQPAAQAGVLDGDTLHTVDALTLTAEMGTDAVVALVRGPVGTTVTLGISRTVAAQDTAQGAAPNQGAAQEQSLELSVIRAEIQTASVEWRLLEDNPRTATIGYLRHTLFSERSADEMRQAIEELTAAGADRFIWDLRGNPGGLVDAATAVVDLWLDDGTLLIEEHADGSSKHYTATPGGPGAGFPLVLLVDGASASASEIVAGALQDHGRARLVGERTFGKGSVQLIYELADASSLHITNAQWFTPNRRPISGSGLAPDIAVEPGTDPLPAAVDAVLAQPVVMDLPD